jgi:F-box/leucine-rich repeat protein 14
MIRHEQNENSRGLLSSPVQDDPKGRPPHPTEQEAMRANSMATIFRGTTMAIVLSTLLGILALPEVRPSRNIVAPSTPSAKNLLSEGRERIVHFPINRSLGSLQIKDLSSNREKDVLDFGQAKYKRWEYLGQATGDVAVPAGKLLGLWVNSSALRDLSPLGRLKPDDLHVLWIAGSEQPSDVEPDDTCMVHLSNLTGLRTLMLVKTNITPNGLRWIRGLKSLTKLYLQSDKLNDAGLAHLSELKSLEILELISPGITDAGLLYLGNLTALKELYVWSPRICGPGLAPLADLPSLSNLNLVGNHFGNDGFKYLRNFHSLKKLTLEWALNLTDAGLPHVAVLVQLTDLNLANTSVTDRGLASLSTLTRLEILNLSNTKITAEGFFYLRAMPSLRKLYLGGNGIGDDGLTYLREMRSLESLEGIDPTDKGLASLTPLSNLRRLYIGGPVTDIGLEHISRLRNLEELNISGSGVTDNGMAHLAKLTNLKSLFLFECPVTRKGLAALAGLTSLQRLSMYNPKITLSDMVCLNATPSLTALKVSQIGRDSLPLNIAGLTRLEDLSLTLSRPSGFRDEDLAGLANLTRLKNLQLCSFDSLIGDRGIQHLSGLTSLEFLNVGGCHITDGGLKCVANLRNLWHLRVTGNFTDIGLRYLEPLKRLAILSVTSENACSSAAINRLREKLPNLCTMTIVP